LRYTDTVSNTGGVSPASGLTVVGCTIEQSAGDAMVIEQLARTAASGPVTVRNSSFAHNGGAGVQVSARGVTLAGNLVYDNHGDGITLHQLAPAAPDSVVSNTSVLNSGTGVFLLVDSGVAASVAVIDRNISAYNGGVGVSVGAFASAVVQHNDAWLSGMADYAGVATPLVDNLSVNPLFCAAATGDFTLQAGSPCAPSGVYVLIGALPVACATAPVGVDSRTPALALTVSPNPSLGGVRFALPSRCEAGTIEVLDLGGRRVWSAPVAPRTESLEWNGRLVGMRASGVFFARLTQGRTSVTQRFVLLK
jgi:hypothetical protein